MIPESNLPPEESLRERLEANPADWNTRLQLASLFYDQGVLHDASVLVWEADRIPCTAPDLALAACILAKDQPGKAIRLLTAVLENNRGEAVQNMGMANALLHHGMVFQAARFYGAAFEINPELVNLEFEHFFIWADDEQLLWRDLQDRRPQLHELPWMTRDGTEASGLIRDFSGHTTPIAVPRLDPVEVEPSATEALREKLIENPGDWETRRTLAQLLHDQGACGEAAVLIWDSDPIPSIDLDIAFAARVLAREQPRKAIRLLTAVFEQNRGKAGQNMGMANALLHHGMVLESARFYGAALDADPNLVNPDLEHFLLWTDDSKSLWENFLKIRPPLGIFPWARSTPTFDFGAPFSTPPLLLSGLRQVRGENLTNRLYQQLAGKNARITPPPAVTFRAEREAPNELHQDFDSGGPDDHEAAAQAKAASLFAEAEESARTLIERARQEATTEVAAIRAKAEEELQADLEQARRETEQEMAAIRAKAREEAAAAADAARKDAEFQAALVRAKAEEAAAEAEAAARLRAEENTRALALAKQRTEEEERSIAAAKRLAEEQAKAAAEQAAAVRVAAEKARQEAASEVAAMRVKAEEELKATLEQARQNSEQELAVIRAKAKEEAEHEAALIRTKAEEDARAAEKVRLEARAQAEAAAKLRAEEDARALALAKQRADEEERSTAAAKRLAEEQARAAAEKIRQEAEAEVSALRAKAREELEASIEQARQNTERELTAIRAKAEEDAKRAAAAAEQARLDAAVRAKAAAEILARAEEQAQAAAREQARLDSEEQLKRLRAGAREESKALMEKAAREAASEVVLMSESEEDARLKSSTAEFAAPEVVANVVEVAKEQPNAVETAGIRQQETHNFKRRFWVLLASAAVAFGVWKWVPGTAVDRTAFTTVAAGFANPPLFVEGKGSHAAPWKLKSFSSETKPDKREAPVIVSLGDDLEGFFQSSPPAPIDLAVVLKNFQRLGAKKAASAAVLAWETPDPIGLAALERSLNGFESLVMAAPVSRGPVASAMPPAFRRASVPLASLHGDTSNLPVVNRLPLPGVILGGETTAAGFSVLDAQPAAGLFPLMARWEDRVVFAFPLLTVLQRLGLPPEAMEIRLGEYLKLGADGPIVPVDAYGRLTVPLKPLSAYAEISAEALIDGGDDLFPKQAPDPVILRDDRTAAEPATRAFSRILSAAVAGIASDEGLAKSREFPRLVRNWEIGILAGIVIVLTLLCGASEFVRNLGALVLAGACLAGQWIGLGMASVWLPGLPLFAAILVMVVVSQVIGKKLSAAAPFLVPVAIPDIVLPPVPEPVIEAVKPKPAPAKKAAKKATPKKTPSKAPRTKKPPSKS
ncbi:MAG: hypothetical protein V4584_12420 [Verrucomicrobiota bacterium]